MFYKAFYFNKFGIDVGFTKKGTVIFIIFTNEPSEEMRQKGWDFQISI